MMVLEEKITVLSGKEKVAKLITDIKLKKITGSYPITTTTVEILKDIVINSEWKNAQDIIKILKAEGRKLSNALPIHASVGNMVRRILKIIREEYVAGQQNKQEEVDPQESLHKIVTSEGEAEDYSKDIPQLKEQVLEHISEFQMELETSIDNIAQQAKEHIHANEIIMTIGKSSVVEAFLKKAAHDRKFDVIVAECAPFLHGHELAASLAKSKIQTTLIPDSAIFGIMSRVNKVIVGTQTVMANGGLRAVCGAHTLALAAKHYSVPVIVLAPMYKLCPEYLCSYDQDLFNSFISPEGVLNFSDGEILDKVHVYNPVFDYVPPELVTLFISNTGGHAPSYVYRLLSELYYPDDHSL
ncbi:translation initiation factor eIF-2B subunit beta [Macrosteles quadrilineatus]|uniref:translation initiation factor eIF-2B subunit beta n=1 Tax=Macrosteles quadrilineatus TaxID=74068 RepID=UPI0023E20930|nr:translation initiation factor eIF-2B subunit beta [Macrosteles quadrilineatus]